MNKKKGGTWHYPKLGNVFRITVFCIRPPRAGERLCLCVDSATVFITIVSKGEFVGAIFSR